jgi:predicted nuclease with TOPRIM domain
MYNKAMEEDFDVQHKIEKIEAELSDLDHHRGLLLDELLRLRGEWRFSTKGHRCVRNSSISQSANLGGYL